MTSILANSDKCIRCGLCLTKCPVIFTTARESFPGPKTIAGDLPRPSHEFTVNEDIIFYCTICGACAEICPADIPVDLITREIRRSLIESGRIAVTLRDALESAFKHGNPWGGLRSKRSEWAEGLGVKDISKGEKAELLYFVGCTASYDTRVQEVARSLVKIFKAADLDFGILGDEEICCGEPVNWIGEEGLFEELAEKNIELFNKYGIKKIVTTSPHCYITFQEDYPSIAEKLGLEFEIEVKHYTQLLAELLQQGKITFSKKVDALVTYQDPCSLGRRSKIFDEPREVLRAIPGLELAEMERTREESYCCGGGGGRIFLETEVKERLSMERVKEASKLDPDVMATACPFCLLQFDDAVKVAGEDIEVKDVAELVAEALG